MSKKNEQKKSELLDTLSDSGRKFSDATLLFHELVAQKAGLASADHKYLGTLVQKGAMTAGELASLTGLTTGAITGVIDRLEKKSLVRRERDEVDRRKVVVVPDREKTWQILAPTFRRLQEKLATVYDQFSESDMKIIIQYLNSTSSAMIELTNELKIEE